MTSAVSALNNIHKAGIFGNHESKNEKNLLNLSEVKNMLIVQIVQYKNSKVSFENIDIDNLKLKNEPLSVVSNNDTRILWNGPKNWLLVSTKKDLLKNISEVFKEQDFAITDLSHSRAIIEISGQDVKEVLKKGCPFNFNILEKNNSINSTYNGIAFTADMIDDKPFKVRIFTLRSFGESLYHSITDSSLEFGYKNIEQVPKLIKISVNRGVGEASKNSKELDSSVDELSLIVGQQPTINKASKSVAGFKIRDGMAIGTSVTLRKEQMYNFLTKLIHIVLPRIRDFRGISPNGFDGRGNYNLGLKEQLIFPEVSYDDVTQIRGLDISIVTTAKTDEEARALLKSFGMPFTAA